MTTWVNGESILLYENGQIITLNRKKAGISKDDFCKSVRPETKEDTLEKIDRAFVEKKRLRQLYKKRSIGIISFCIVIALSQFK